MRAAISKPRKSGKQDALHVLSRSAFLLACLLVGEPSALAEGATRPASETPLWTREPPRAVGLDEALAYAQANQPSLRAALDRVRAARADARIPRARWLPSVGAAAELFEGTANNTTAAFLGTPEVALPRIGATKVIDSNGQSVNFSGGLLAWGLIAPIIYYFISPYFTPELFCWSASLLYTST